MSDDQAQGNPAPGLPVGGTGEPRGEGGDAALRRRERDEARGRRRHEREEARKQRQQDNDAVRRQRRRETDDTQKLRRREYDDSQRQRPGPGTDGPPSP